MALKSVPVPAAESLPATQLVQSVPCYLEAENSVKGRFAVMASKNFMTLPLTPLQNKDDVVELFQLSIAISKSAEQTRSSAHDFTPRSVDPGLGECS